MGSTTLAARVACVTQAIDDAAGRGASVVLVGHSAAGPVIATAAGERPGNVHHVVFVSCLVPAPGSDGLDSLPRPMRWYIRRRLRKPGAGSVLGATGVRRRYTRWLLCHDLDEPAASEVLAQLVPEPTAPAEPFDYLEPFWSVPRTFVMLTGDRAIRPKRQMEAVERLSPVQVVAIASGHMVTHSEPAKLADVLNGLALPR